jgi:secreted protein with Ig-like and vWFA domain
MNSDRPQTPPPDPESRITALLLGELDEAEAASVRREIEGSPELAALQERLRRTLELVRLSVNPGAAAVAATPSRLSEARRTRLLRRLQRTSSTGFLRRFREQVVWLGPMAAAAALVGVLGAGALLAWREKDAPRAMAERSDWSAPARFASVTVTESLRPVEVEEESQGVRAESLAEVPQTAPAVPFAYATAPAPEAAALQGASKDERRFGTELPALVAGIGGAVKGKQVQDPGEQSLFLRRNADLNAAATAPGGPAAAPPPPASHLGYAGGGAGAGFGVIADNRAGLPTKSGSPIPSSEAPAEAVRSNLRGTAEADALTRSKAEGLDAVPADKAAKLEIWAEPREYKLRETTTDWAFHSTPPPNPPAPVGQPQPEPSLRQLPVLEAGAPVEGKKEALGRTVDRFLKSSSDEKAGKPVQLALGGVVLDTSDGNRAKRLAGREALSDVDAAVVVPRAPGPVPQPEVAALENPFSTFSLNVSDVSFRLAAASLEKGVVPDPAGIRSEEFINAFDYRDPEPAPGVPVGFAWERATWPFAQQRDLVRFAVRTAARGRENARPLQVVVLLDNSGSMERADRVQIVREALRVLGRQLQPQDRLSLVTFARTPRLWLDDIPGNQASARLESLGTLNPEGGTNLEEALKLAYATASRHFLAPGVNRVVLLTDGAANLGDVDAASLRRTVESWRRRGVALDCFGIGWEGYNDDLLEQLSRNGDGRYGFVNTPEEAASGFASQLAGALQVAAADVKVQVEFNPHRVTLWRQVGYARHQLTKEQFRDNTVDAAELGAAEAGNALYVVQTNPQGAGPLATVRVRFRVPETGAYREHEWVVPFQGPATNLDQSSPALRLAGVAAAFAEMLSGSPFAGEVTADRLMPLLRDVPVAFQPDPRPARLPGMIQQARSAMGTR